MMLIASTLALLAIARPSAAGALDRGLLTDRPGPTDHARTIPAGQRRLEVGALVHRGTTTLADADLTFGLSENAELQLGSTERVAALRLKYNLLGNDVGDVGAAVMPNLNVEYGDSVPRAGLNVPLTWSLRGGWGLSIMPVLVDRRDFALPLVLSLDLSPRLTVYGQYEAPSRGVGLAYRPGPWTQVDIEVDLAPAAVAIGTSLAF